jgi:hypothetical protein
MLGSVVPSLDVMRRMRSVMTPEELQAAFARRCVALCVRARVHGCVGSGAAAGSVTAGGRLQSAAAAAGGGFVLLHAPCTHSCDRVLRAGRRR